MPTFDKKKNPGRVAGGRARAAQRRPPAFSEPPVIFDEPTFDEPMADVEADEATEHRRLHDVITTKADFVVAGFGSVQGTTTHLVKALLGKKIRVPNSAWPGYTARSSDCVIDAYVRKLHWSSAPAPALIVRTVADGAHYAFAPAQILQIMGATARLHAEKEMALLELRARIEEDGFETARPDAPPPDDVETGHSALDPELRTMRKYIWLSERLGRRWRGTAYSFSGCCSIGCSSRNHTAVVGGICASDSPFRTPWLQLTIPYTMAPAHHSVHHGSTPLCPTRAPSMNPFFTPPTSISLCGIYLSRA